MAKRKARAGRKPARDRHAIDGDEESSPVLGRRMFTLAITLTGSLSEAVWREFLVELVATMNMTPVDEPAIWRYPVNGCGGNGMTVVQPITESFIALDTWPDHCGAYLYVSSCKQFSPSSLLPAYRSFSLEPGQYVACSLGLDEP